MNNLDLSATNPGGLDISDYRSRYPDLGTLNDAELTAHFEQHGIAEGRIGSPVALRENLIELAGREPSILEIGPFVRPLLIGGNVSYFDVLDQQSLVKRAVEVEMVVEKSVPIDFVHPSGDLSIVDRKFAAIISSHAIEHQPNLVDHLRRVAQLLEPGGSYYLVVPDKRFCFDHHLAETSIADVIEAERLNRRTHSLTSVIEHRALITHNDCVAHWRGEHGPKRSPDTARRARAALDEFNEANGAYIDVHAWKFTPASFRAIIADLHDLGMIDLAPLFVAETPRYRNEFTALLRLAR